MDVKLLVLKTFRRLRAVGFPAAIRESLAQIRFQRASDEFDMKHGTDTGGSQPLWRLRISSPNARFGVKYQPTDEDELVDTVNYLGLDVEAFTFVDLGCGKGRTLLVASHLGFKQVIGVEFADDLVQIARKNITQLGISNAAVVHGDAATFRFPSGNLVVYLYNPFSQEVMHRVIENLRACRLQRLYVIYKVACCAQLFDESGYLSRVESQAARPSIKIWGTAGGVWIAEA